MSATARDGHPHPEWVRHYLEGATLQEVAGDLAITREAVRLRLGRLGIAPRSAAATRELQYQTAVAKRGPAIRERFLDLRDVSVVAAEASMTPKVVTRFLRETIPDLDVLLRTPRNPKTRYTTEDLTQSLVAAAEEIQGSLTSEQYRAFVEKHPSLDDGRPRPGKQAMALRYGSWRDALAAAGLPANPTSGVQKKFDDEAVVIQAIVECWRDIGGPPTVADYDKWGPVARGRPSSATARKLIGSWDSGRLRAWQIIHQIVLDQDDEEAAVPKQLLESASGAQSGLGSEAEYSPYRRADEHVAIQEPIGITIDDYQAQERALTSHARIQNVIADLLDEMDLTPLSPGAAGPQFDLAFIDAADVFVVVEVKSATNSNLELQLRLGLGQVLRYAHQLRQSHPCVQPILAVELVPDMDWVALIEEHGVMVLCEPTLAIDLMAALVSEAPIDAS